MKKTLLLASAVAAFAVPALAETVIYEHDGELTTKSLNFESLKVDAPVLVDAWTLQFDGIVGTADGYQDIFKFGSSPDSNHYHLWVHTAEDRLGFDKKGVLESQDSMASHCTDFTLDDDTYHTFTIVSTGTVSPTLSLYIDGADEAIATRSYNLNTAGENATSPTWSMHYLTFGGGLTSVKNVTLASIPEPATATLSLLALAGMAARRRRK